MKLHILGLGNVGSLLAHHIRLRHPAPPIVVALTDRALVKRFTDRHRLRPDDRYPGLYAGLTLNIRTEPRVDVESSSDYLVCDYSRRSDLHAPQHPTSEPISLLIVTTKTHQTTKALSVLKDKLSRDSTIFILQNGMGLVDDIFNEVFPDRHSRPTMIFGNTNHGIRYKESDQVNTQDSSASVYKSAGSRIYHHTGLGDIHYAILPTLLQKDTDSSEGYTMALLHKLKSLPSSGEAISEKTITESAVRDASLPRSTLEMLDILSSLETLRPNLIPWQDLLIKQLIKLPVNAFINTITAILRTSNAFCLEEEALQIARQVAGECELIYSRLLGHPDSKARNFETSKSVDNSYLTQPAVLSNGSPRNNSPDATKNTESKWIVPEHFSALRADAIFDSIVHTARLTGSNFSSMASDVWNDTGSKSGESNYIETFPANRSNSSTEIEYINGYLHKLAKATGVNASTITITTLASLVILTERSLKFGVSQRRSG